MSARRVAYTVVNATSEDEGHPATELNQQNPQTKGWQSDRFCTFPQEICIEFSQRCDLVQLQVLSHQYKIASKVELFIWDEQDPTDDGNYRRLGHFSLNQNERSDYEARELKSVQLKGRATHMKLRLNQCHINKYNHYSQVGIVALSVFGVSSQARPGSEPKDTVDPLELLSGQTDPRIAHPQYAAPSAGGAPGSIDDLAFDLNVDPETASKIRDLAQEKEMAVENEDYDRAKWCKAEIQRLQKTASQIIRLEAQKKLAVEREDYDMAKRCKEEIENIRNPPPPTPPYQSAQPSAMGSRASMNPSPANSGGYNDRPLSGQMAGGGGGQMGPPGELPPSPWYHGQGGVFPSSAGQPGSMRDAPPPVAAQALPPFEAQDTYPTIQPVVQQAPLMPQHDQPSPVESHPDDALSHAGRPGGSSRPHSRQLNVGRGGATELSEQPLGMEQPVGMAQPSDFPPGAAPARADQGEPEPLSRDDAAKAEDMLDAFGDYDTRCIFSKDRQLREGAIEKLAEGLSGLEQGSSQVLKALCQLLNRTFTEKIQSVYMKGFPLLSAVTEQYCPGVSPQEVQRQMGSVVPILVERTADNNARTSKAAIEGLHSLARYQPLRGVVVEASTKKINAPKQKAYPHLQGRLHLIAALLPDVGVGPASHSFDQADVLEFIMNGFESPKPECRDAALSATVELARLCESDAERVDLLGEIYKDMKPAQRQLVEKTVNQMLGSAPQRAAAPKAGGGAGGAAKARPQVQTEEAPTPRKQDMNQSIKMKESLSNMAKLRSPSVARSPGLGPNSSRVDGDNEGELSGEFDDEGPSDTCQFCGLYDPQFTDDTLDYHFWQDCPMLCSCKHCGQVIEIPCLSEHMLLECEHKERFRQCPRCDEAIEVEQFQAHVAAANCIVAKPPEKYNRCPLCHTDIPPGDEGWQEHLLFPPGCPANARRVPKNLIAQMRQPS